MPVLRWSALTCAAAALAAAACANDKSAPAGPQLADLGIDVAPTASRAFIYTNKGDAFFYGEAAGPQQSSWQGFNVRGFIFVDDWQWATAQGSLGSTGFSGATVYPDHAVRRYTAGPSETIALLDGRRALLVEPTGAGPLTLRPLMADSATASYYQVQASGGALAVARANHLVSSGPNDYPVWLVVKAAGATAAADAQLVTAGGLKPKMMSPGTLALAGDGPVAFAVGDTLADATATADAALAQAPQLRAARADRMQKLLGESWVQTADADFNRAAAWIRLSVDALVMDQQGKGVFAGIPWFNNYWGRDTFITLGGSHLATGQWEEAKDILTAFSAHQDTDTGSTTYGRIPNQVSLGGVSYNTTDGTPWFVIQTAAYLLRSDDAAFAAAIWPVVQRATDGALQHVDATGYLLHGDQETWMDATGPNGPYTPRGDRAVEIQGLFYEQLLASATIADEVGQSQAATAYRAAAAKIAASFYSDYLDPLRGTLVDRLEPDGTQDAHVRPNQFMALRSLAAALPPDQVQKMTRWAAERLAYRHGVASLTPLDDFFHPYHILAGYYPKDEAYHNGVVWPWLSGPLVSLMVSQGAATKAWELLESLDDLALVRATVGTLPELIDALPRLKPGTPTPTLGTDPPQPAGTPFQAWSHGEYLRNVYEDFLGIRYVAADHVVLAPSLPPSWGATAARFRVGAGWITARLTPGTGALDVELVGEGNLASSTVVTVKALGTSRDVGVTQGTDQKVQLQGTETVAAGWSDFDWRALVLPPDLPALRYPGFVVLDRDAIKQPPGADVRTRLSLGDPAGDDTGPPGEQYTYPTDTHFLPGILDLTQMGLAEDSGAFYFTLTFANIVQPGWNPQDGFQLTYAAVLLGTHATEERTVVAHKAGYELPAGAGFQYAIYVGAGFEVQDVSGQVIASYTPQSADVIDPLGSVDTKTISFRVPKAVLPAVPEGTTVTILVGSQDDYGNGSMGDFRVVSATAAQWVGGGKSVSSGPNVYDFATGTVVP